VLAGLSSVPAWIQIWSCARNYVKQIQACVCYSINILGSQLSPSSINLVPALAGKVTVGLVWHWPCVTDTVVYPPIRAQRPKTGRWAPTPKPLSGRGTIYLFI